MLDPLSSIEFDLTMQWYSLSLFGSALGKGHAPKKENNSEME